MIKKDSLREIKIFSHVIDHAEGSVKIQWGKTEILCCASIEESIPRWLKGKGWVTAEYNMLPCATSSRSKRDKTLFSGRTKEISRLIGRSLRSCVDLKQLGERQILIDCDVLQADGGTRTAAITGGFIALALALQKLIQNSVIKINPLLYYVSAVGVAVLEDQIIVDPSAKEDQECSTDMNIVCSSQGDFIEIQGTAEKKPFNQNQLIEITNQAKKACEMIFLKQAQVIGDFFPLKKR